MPDTELNLQIIKNDLLNDGKFNIVFLGDSLTSAEWVHPNWREVIEYVLKEELIKIFDDWKIPSWGIRCYNSGFDGASTKDLTDRLENHVFSYRPDLVICIIGDNDMVYGITPEESREYTKQLIQNITSQIPKLVYCSTIASGNKNYNQRYEKYLEQIISLFPQPKVQFLNLYKIFQQYSLNKFFTFVSSGNPEVGIKPGEIDFLHPNQLGNAYLAEILLKEIFQIDFNPEKYLQDTLSGKMYPEYWL